MSRIRITPLAEQDLVEIWYFIAQDDPLAADRLLDLLEEKYKLLADNPHVGPARPDIAKELRYHPVGSYLLLYRIISGGIELVRVVHGARDLQFLFQHRQCLTDALYRRHQNILARCVQGVSLPQA